MAISNLPRRPLPRGRRWAAIATICVTLVGGFEGLRTVAYEDPIGIPTLCFGETRGVKMGDTATPAECDAMLEGRLVEFSAAIDKCLPPWTPDPSYVAFLSAAYNIGSTAFCSSSMARHARGGNIQAACDSLLLWDKVTIAGVKTRLPGLTRRRVEERALCLTGLAA